MVLAAVEVSGLAMDRVVPSSFAVGRLTVKLQPSFQRSNSSMQTKLVAAIAAPTRQVQQQLVDSTGSKYHHPLPSSKG